MKIKFKRLQNDSMLRVLAIHKCAINQIPKNKKNKLCPSLRWKKESIKSGNSPLEREERPQNQSSLTEE